MSPATALQLDPRLDQARDRLVYALAGSVVEQYTLDADDEASIAGQVQGIVFDVLTIADGLAANLHELRAVRSRLDRHRETHPGCREIGCPSVGALRQRIAQLQRSCERQAAQLGGRH